MNFKKVFEVSKSVLKHPLGRGMLTYSITWPTAAFIQELYDKRNLGDIDWNKCVRFSMYGCLFVAPTFYSWVQFASKIFPHTTMASLIKKALFVPITYNPMSTFAFLFIMTYAETKNFDSVQEEIRNKFWVTYKVAVYFWPLVQALNFAFIPDRNRLVFSSFCGLLWIMCLAYIKEHGSPLDILLKKSKSDEPSK